MSARYKSSETDKLTFVVPDTRFVKPRETRKQEISHKLQVEAAKDRIVPRARPAIPHYPGPGSEDYEKRRAEKPKRNKYGNKKTLVDGISFDSAKEAKRWGELKLLERSGKIQGLRRQVKYLITHADVKICTYVCDFQYYVAGKEVVEDSKGFRTQIYRMKKKLMKAFFKVDILET